MEEGEGKVANSPAEAVQRFAESCQHLVFLDWLGECQEAWTQMIFIRVRQRIHSRCAQVFDQPCLESLLLWLERVVSPWLATLFGVHSSHANLSSSSSSSSSLPPTTSFSASFSSLVSSSSSSAAYKQWKSR